MHYESLLGSFGVSDWNTLTISIMCLVQYLVAHVETDIYWFVSLKTEIENLPIFILQNSAPAPQENSRPVDITPAKKKKEVNAGQIEK